jgi:hypothetical protein
MNILPTGVFLLNVEEDTVTAIKLIERFRFINNKRFQIRIYYDYSTIDDFGYFKFDDTGPISNLYINPQKCHKELANGRAALGFTEDYSVLSTILHEFSHFIDDKYNLLSKYEKITFESIDLGSYANSELIEEFAELMVLYLLNPYFLKIIDLPRYKFLKSQFKSPSPKSKKRFLTLYNSWSEDVKQECFDKFNIKVKNNNIEV